MIQARNVAYEYFRRDEEGNVTEINRALDGVTLDIKQGEFIAVLGANGSGKSTFAKHLNALLTPSEGTLVIDGRNCSDLEQLWKIRQTTGMVFQNPDNQIIANVVEEDVGFGPENIGVPTEQIWGRVNESLDAVGMTKFRKYSPNQLSGGQKQRVAIAGVMAMRTKCIVLDESTAMLDPSGRKEVMETVLRLNKEEGITVILITHHMDEVVNADRVYVMYKGNVEMEGTPRELFAQVEQLKEYRLDVPQVTKLSYELRKEGINLPESILTVEELVEELQKILKSKKIS